MLSENDCIEACKKLIEERFHLPSEESWKQRDFEYLSDLIVEKSGARLSISTLKRIWKEPKDRLPQLYTLNALAVMAGYSNWTQFKQIHQPENLQTAKSQTTKAVPRTKYLYTLLALAALICPFALIYFRRTSPTYLNEIAFKARRIVSSGVPNTVVFEYDISRARFDSAFIQHTWDKRLRAKVTRDSHFQTFIYYVPGFHKAKLMLNDKVVKEENVTIATSGWEGMVSLVPSGTQPIYIPKEDLFAKDGLHITLDKLIKNHVPVNDKPYKVNFYNVSAQKGAFGENFTLKTRIKNNITEGALVCQYVNVSLICEEGLISVPFCYPGCSANILLHVSEVFMHGRKNDMSALGIDLSQWRNIEISAIQKQLYVSVDGETVYKVPFKSKLGQITGFHYQFHGAGAVDFVKLYNADNKVVFSDELELAP